MLDKEKSEVASQGARGTLFNIASAAIGKGSGLLFYIVLLRFVTPAEGGIYFLYIAFATVIGILGAFGMADSLARFIPFYEGGGRRGKIRPLVATVFLAFLVFSAILGAATFFGQGAVARYYSADLASIIYMTYWTGVALSLNSVLTLALFGFKRFDEVAAWSALQPVLKIGFAGAAFLLLAGGLDAALWATFLAAMVSNVGMLVSVAFRLGKFPGRLGILGKKEIGEIFKYGNAAALNQFSGSLMSYTDTMVLAYYVAAPVIGAYNAVMNMARSAIQTISAQIFSVLTSMLSHLHGAKSEVFGPLASNGARWSAYITLPIAALSMLFAKEAVELFFPAYAEYYWLMYVLVPGLLISVVSLPARSALSAIGRTDLLLKSTLIGILPNIALNLLLVPIYGLWGALAGTTLAYLVSEGLAIYYSMRLAKFSLHAMIANAFAPTMVMFGAGFASYRLLFDFSAAGHWAELLGVILASLLAFLVYFLFLVWLGGLNRTDRHLVDKTVRAALGMAGLKISLQR